MNPSLEKWITVAVVFTVLLVGMAIGYWIAPLSGSVEGHGESVPEMVRVPLPDGKFINVPKDTAVRVRIQKPGSTDEETSMQAENGTAIGVGVETSSDSISESLETGAPSISFGKDFFGQAGSVMYDAKLWTSKGGNLFLLIGIALVAGGVVVLVWLKITGLGFAMIAAGGVTLGVSVLYERAPWVLGLGAMAVLGIAVWTFFSLRKGKQSLLALTDVVNTIEDEFVAVKNNPNIADFKNTIVARLKDAIKARSGNGGHPVINWITGRRT